MGEQRRLSPRPRAGPRRGRLLYGAAAQRALGRGIGQLAALIAPTLGPTARTVAIESLVSKTPEVLDSGATIARRMLQLPDPFEDMGAMLLRHLLLRVFERTGDGTATTAVLTQALVRALQRYTLQGGDLPSLQRGLSCGLAVVVEALAAQARPIDGAAAIAGVADCVVRNRAIAGRIGEILEATGPDGAIIVESGEAVETTFEYLEGVRWDSGLVSPDVFLPSGQASLRLVEPCLLITDVVLDAPERVAPVLEAAVALGAPRLFIVAPEVREPVIALLATNVQRGVLEAAAVVQAPSTGDVRAAILGDLAVIGGGHLVQHAAGGLAEFVPADLGRARQAWATRSAFGILGGRGTRGAIRQRVAEARAALQRAADDQYQRSMAQQRIGRLLGIGAVIRVGAASELAREDLRLRAEAAVNAARLALEDGVVAGGGLALVRAAAALRCRAWQADEAVAAQVLAVALEAPLRTILRNAGAQAPGRVLDEAGRRGAWETFDVVRGTWVDAWQTGLLDPLAVTRTAVEVSASAARTALTTGALVLRRQVRPPAGR